MAEARRQEEEELRDGRNRNQPTDRSERNKPERHHSSSGSGSGSQSTGIRGPSYPSQGSLSSIRAAIKRTRTSSQGDHARDRRRPEITILSAEPLASTAWFPGASGGFPPPPPPAQTWTGSIQPAAQPPPSYDQVLQEKTQEHVPTPTAAPRRSVTIATQTDPVEEDDATAASPECTAAPQPINKTVKKPQKPPRPSLPKPLQSDSATETPASGPSPVDATTTTTSTDTEQTDPQTATNTENQTDPQSATNTEHQTDPQSATNTEDQTDPQSATNTENHTDPQSATNTENQTDPQSATNTEDQTDPQSATNTENQTDPQSATNTEDQTDPQSTTNTEDQTDPQSATAQPSHPETSHTISYSPSPSVTVTIPLPVPRSTPISSVPSVPSEPPLPPSAESPPTQRPTPLPRLKSRKLLIPEEVKVQTLVRFGDNGDIAGVTPPSDTEVLPSGTYLQDLLDAFCSDDQWERSSDFTSDPSDTSDQSEEGEDGGGSDGGEMSALHSQRNIRARIQALERQATVDGAECPEPLPRNAHPKPPAVAAKPALAPRPSVKVKEEINANNNNYQAVVAALSSPNYQAVVAALSSPTPAPRPQVPKKPVEPPPPRQEEPEAPPTKTAILPPSRPSVLARAKSFLPPEAEGPVIPLAGPPTPPEKPSKEPLYFNLNNHNSVSVSMETSSENEYVDNPTAKATPAKPVRVVGSGGSFSRQSTARRPTTIRVPSKAKLFEEDSPPPLPSQKPVGGLPPPVTRKPSLASRPSQDSIHSEPEPSLPPRPSGVKVLPPRPPPAKAGPGRPPPPRVDGSRRPPSVHGAPGGASPKLAQGQKPKRKGPVLPPRPNPGHRLYNKYTLELPHGIAEFDYNGSNTGELSFQKNEVLLLLDQVDHKTFECQAGDAKGPVQKSRMKVITPLSSSVPNKPAPQGTSPAGSRRDSSGLQVYAVYDFTSEGPGELSLKVGDVVTQVEQVDSDWYRGSCNGASGCFPVNYVKVMSNASTPTPTRTQTPTNVKKARPATVSGPRGVARFDFEGEHSDELCFSEGDVVLLKEYMGQDWARGQLGDYTGIFPISFLEVIEDLPPPPAQQQTVTKIALPGMTASTKTREAAKSIKPPSPGGEQWAVALYAFTGQTEEDLSFQQGDTILVTEHIDAEWCFGKLNGRQGVFPKAFIEPSSGPSAGRGAEQSTGTEAEGGRGKALFDFTSDCEEELSLKVGDIVTNLESIDDEWFLADLRGKRAMVPKNYVQVLA